MDDHYGRSLPIENKRKMNAVCFELYYFSHKFKNSRLHMFFKSLRDSTLLKRDSNRGIFLDNLKEMRGPFPKKILKVPISIYFFEFQGASQSEHKKIKTDSR